METSLRLGLLLIGFVIVLGIIWDSKRSGKKTKKFPRRTESTYTKKEAFLEEDIFKETVLIQNEEMASPLPQQTVPLSTKSSATKHEEIILLHVMAKFGVFPGSGILDVFNDLNLYYGDRQIFYRYENIDSTGSIMFNVVSAVEPGHFEISKMENFTTPGLTLFFTLTKPNQSIAAFELMLRTAKQLAMRLNGEVLDERRRILTPLVIEQCRERVRKSTSSLRTSRI